MVGAMNPVLKCKLKGIKKNYDLTTERIDAIFFCVSRVISRIKVSNVLVRSFNLINLMSCYIKNNYLSSMMSCYKNKNYCTVEMKV